MSSDEPSAIGGKADNGSEFSGNRGAVLAAALGVGLGVSGLLTYNSGLFVHDLQAEFGLTRTTYGTIFFASTLGIAAAMPFAARAIKRFGPASPR